MLAASSRLAGIRVFGSVYVSVGAHTHTHAIEEVLAAALRDADDQGKLLYHFRDAPYCRSSWSLGGDASAVMHAIENAAEHIRTHSHTYAHTHPAAPPVPSITTYHHPRVGLVDHIVLHPLPGTTLSDAGRAAREVARRVCDRLCVPVYTYGAARWVVQGEKRQSNSESSILAQAHATDAAASAGEWAGAPSVAEMDALPEREVAWMCAQELAETRARLSFFKQTTISELSSGTTQCVPCFAPAAARTELGICVVGACPAILNFNVALRGVPMTVARSIARTCSFRAGGLPMVQSMALVRPPITQAPRPVPSLALHAACSSSECSATAVTGAAGSMTEELPSIVEIACNLLHLPSSSPAHVLDKIRSELGKHGYDKEQTEQYAYEIGLTQDQAARALQPMQQDQVAVEHASGEQ